MYLERFTLPDAEQEEELIMERICETRDCAGFVDNPYPCRLFPARGAAGALFSKYDHHLRGQRLRQKHPA